uniref:Putative spore wall protein 13 n=1 Tax=Nosema pernyi TaxID=1112939 RepID=X5EPA7_9MICR|nr:putative spore wall protein 13 [Nosema pernyi]
MILIRLLAVVLCEVAFLEIKSPDNKKVITGMDSLRLESLDNKKNVFFRFEKKSGVGSKKKGEMYSEDENGVKKYLCLLPTANNEVNLRKEKHDVFITKLKNNTFRISNNRNDCLTIEDNKVTSKKCVRNKNQHFNITFYKNNPEENELDKDAKDPDVEVDQTRSEKKKNSSTTYEDDVDVYVNKDEDKTAKKDVVWVEKPKKSVTSDENKKYRVLKPERFKENRSTSVRIKPGVIEEKQVADVIEKIVSTTISTTSTETVTKMEVVTEYLPVESTTTIQIPSEQILPPISTAKSYQAESQLAPSVQIPSQPLFPELEPFYSSKSQEPASIYIKPDVESITNSSPPDSEIYSSILAKERPSRRPELRPIYTSQLSKTASIDKMPELEPIYGVKPSRSGHKNQYSYLESDSEESSDNISPPPTAKRSAVKIRRKRSALTEEPDSNLDLSCSSEELSSDSSGIDSSEQRHFGKKLEKLTKEMNKIRLKMSHPQQSNVDNSESVKTHSENASISQKKNMVQSKETKIQNDKQTKVEIEQKEKISDHENKLDRKNIHLTSHHGMPQEEVDINMTTLMFDDVLSSALGQDSDIFNGSGLNGLKDELAGTGIEELIGDKLKKKEQNSSHPVAPNHQHIPKMSVSHQRVSQSPFQHQPVQHPSFRPPQQQPIQQQAVILPVIHFKPITPHHNIHQPVQNNNQPMLMPNPVQSGVLESKPVEIQPNPTVQNYNTNEQIVMTQPVQMPNEEIQAQSDFTSNNKNSKNKKISENLDDLDKMFLSGEDIGDHPLRRKKVKSNEIS